MAIFNSYVSLPEGIFDNFDDFDDFWRNQNEFGCVICWTTSVMPRHEYDPLNLKDFSPSKMAFSDRRKRNLGGPKATATATSFPSKKTKKKQKT